VKLARWAAAGLMLLVAGIMPALAVNPSEMLQDPALEKRAEAIGETLRCLVCQNESIEVSDADLAHDLRVLVRQRVQAGDSDDQVRAFLVSRYGEFVLLKPVFALHTLLLWLLAPALIVGGGVVLFIMSRRRKALSTPAELTDEETAALSRLGASDHPD
jgi:cytochrome c-type biogenesis protein CcmH